MPRPTFREDSLRPAAAPPTPEAIVDRKRPAFIVGCGHSGTSLLAAMMDSHSRFLTYPGESGAFSKGDWPRAADRLLDLAKDADARGIPRICEKTPNHVYRISQILQLMPSARILFIVRDGRDVAVSILRRLGSLDAGVRRWLQDNSAGLRQSEGNDRVHILRYEDLVGEPRATLTKVCAFLGESFEEGMLDYHEVERAWFNVRQIAAVELVHEDGISDQERDRRHRLRRNYQINQPLFDGRGAWKALDEAQQAGMTASMRPLLEKFGYL